MAVTQIDIDQDALDRVMALSGRGRGAAAPGRERRPVIYLLDTSAFPDAAVPKNAGRWISAVQHQMARAGRHRPQPLNRAVSEAGPPRRV